jgi:hypothetical protein
MDKKIKSAFDQIHADASLKDSVKTSLAEKLYAKKEKSRKFRLAPALSLAVVMLLGAIGYFSYTTPVMAISLDINPSIELKVNTFDRIIDVTPYNDDGKIVIDETEIKNMNYQKGIDSLLENQTISSCIKDGNNLEVTVALASQNKYEKVKSILAQSNINKNCIYRCNNNEEVEKAHSLGLSFGKYRAYIELKKVNPDITADDVKGLTMREIRDMIENETGSENESSGQNYNGNGQSYGSPSGGGQGFHNGNGKGQGRGKQNKK